MCSKWPIFSDVAVRQFHYLHTKELAAWSPKFGNVRNVALTPYLRKTKGDSTTEISAKSVNAEKATGHAAIVIPTDTDKNAAIPDNKPSAEATKDSKEMAPETQESKTGAGKHFW